ncbi:response regulator transcription factor [Saccharopolyspora griseoalba]|uniref:Response regulator transcription factor n=1 Tax=Saccharopolyspora griseoalba TaxID=1431848 RepID=A0ABW2LDG0_9PSEU
MLAVESNARTVRELRTGLSTSRTEVVDCADPAEALLLLGRLCPDAVVLGEVLGNLTPLTFLRIARGQDPDLPIVAAADSPTNQFAVQAAENGATDVVARPADPHELHDALRLDEHRPQPLDLGRLRIDGSLPRMWVDGEEVKLPPRELAVLRLLAHRVDTTVSRAELVEAAWGPHGSDVDNSLSVHVMRLRRRLRETSGSGQWITAVRGVGYRLRVPPRAFRSDLATPDDDERSS